MSGYDAVVVGAGMIGAAVTYGLVRAGLTNVLVCERGRPPGLGATTRSGALLRQHHTARCDTVLAVEGIRVFRHWKAEVGGECGYRRTGFAVLVDAKYTDHLAKNVGVVNEAGGDSSVLTASELVGRYPGLRVPDGMLAGHEPDGGYADPIAATASLLAAATRRGASISEGVRVTEVRCTGSRVTGVRTSLGTVETGLVVVCGGGWTPALTEPLGVRLPLESRRIGIARAATGLAAGDLPIMIDDTLRTYCRPVEDGSVYFGVSLDPAVHIDVEPEPINGAEAAAAAGRLQARIPALSTAPLVGSRVGFDVYTPDRRPLIGWAGVEGMYVCTGFSGGGIKLAPAVGSLVAEEIVRGTHAESLEPYRPGRFDAGAPVESEYPYGFI